MNTFKKILLLLALLCILLPLRGVYAQEPTPTPETPIEPTSTPEASGPPTPADIINAVNSLRLSHGMAPLAVHPALMQIAQEVANGLSFGQVGHWRPNDITLGQWLLSLGYPLSGDLSLDGYRSENFINGPNLTVQDAIRAWGSDDPHSNTMLSPNRSDIGAGVATATDEWGNTAYYYVLETALQTKSGQMSSDAYPILTQMASSGTHQAAMDGSISDYSITVAMSTALPNGDVYHEVQYGQTLWSIAIQYNTTIAQLQRLNNLPDTIIMVKTNLLVSRGATQPAPEQNVTGIPPAESTFVAATLTQRPTPTPTLQMPIHFSEQKQQGNAFIIGAIAFAAITLGGVFAAMLKGKTA